MKWVGNIAVLLGIGEPSVPEVARSPLLEKTQNMISEAKDLVDEVFSAKPQGKLERPENVVSPPPRSPQTPLLPRETVQSSQYIKKIPKRRKPVNLRNLQSKRDETWKKYSDKKGKRKSNARKSQKCIPVEPNSDFDLTQELLNELPPELREEALMDMNAPEVSIKPKTRKRNTQRIRPLSRKFARKTPNHYTPDIAQSGAGFNWGADGDFEIS